MKRENKDIRLSSTQDYTQVPLRSLAYQSLSLLMKKMKSIPIEIPTETVLSLKIPFESVKMQLPVAMAIHLCYIVSEFFALARSENWLILRNGKDLTENIRFAHGE